MENLEQARRDLALHYDLTWDYISPRWGLHAKGPLARVAFPATRRQRRALKRAGYEYNAKLRGWVRAQ